MTKIIIFIILAAALVAGGVYYNHRADELARQKAAAEAAAQEAETRAEEIRLMNSIQKTDLVVGSGVEAKNGDALTVNYAGTLDDGTEFDSSYDRGQSFTFTLGKGDVIKGWDLGLLGMKVGGKRQLVIPPELGYGAAAVGPIPPNSTLHFTVELLSVNATSSTK